MISDQTLTQVGARVTELGGLSEPTVATLRQAWPDIHFTYCSEDDVPAQLKPAGRGEGFAIYLVSGAQHCVGFTYDQGAATGLVLAAASED